VSEAVAWPDRLRQAVVCEPRGHDAVVGALLTPPVGVDVRRYFSVGTSGCGPRASNRFRSS
jgi:proline racemase